jgi:hypothetical protein
MGLFSSSYHWFVTRAKVMILEMTGVRILGCVETENSLLVCVVKVCLIYVLLGITRKRGCGNSERERE